MPNKMCTRAARGAGRTEVEEADGALLRGPSEAGREQPYQEKGNGMSRLRGARGPGVS